jgi:hypothetical protein
VRPVKPGTAWAIPPVTRQDRPAWRHAPTPRAGRADRVRLVDAAVSGAHATALAKGAPGADHQPHQRSWLPDAQRRYVPGIFCLQADRLQGLEGCSEHAYCAACRRTSAKRCSGQRCGPRLYRNRSPVTGDGRPFRKVRPKPSGWPCRMTMTKPAGTSPRVGVCPGEEQGANIGATNCK